MTAIGSRVSSLPCRTCPLISSAFAVRTTSVWCRPASAPKTLLRQSPGFARRITCQAGNEGGAGRQYETEFFRKLFGTPPAPKAESADGGDGDEPPDGSQSVAEDEEPDEEQIQRAKQAARQQALFNTISLALFCGVLAAMSTWKPYFLYLGRMWSFVRVGSQAQAYGEIFTEGLAWVLLLTMGWPWNLLIYPGHLTRKELTNARKEGRSPTFANIRNSVYNPFARRHPPPVTA